MSRSNGKGFLLDVGGGVSESGGCPKTRPAAAAAAEVPVPTSCSETMLAGAHGDRVSRLRFEGRRDSPQGGEGRGIGGSRGRDISLGGVEGGWNPVRVSCPTCWSVFVFCEGGRGGALEWDCFRPTYTRHDLHLGCGLLCRRLAAAGEKGDKSGFGTREGRGSHRQDMTGGNARGGDEGFAGMLPESRESRQFLESGAVVLAAARSTSRAGRLGQGTGAGALSVSICRWARCKTGRRRGFVGGQDRSGGLVAAGDAVVGGKTRPDLSNTHNRSGSGPSEVSAADGEAIKRETCEVRGRDGAALSCGLAARAWSGRDCTQAAPHFRRPNLSPASRFQKEAVRTHGVEVPASG